VTAAAGPQRVGPPRGRRALRSELTARPSAAAAPTVRDVLDPRDLATGPAEVAARQRSPETRRTYAAVYRTFAAFPRLGGLEACKPSRAISPGLTPAHYEPIPGRLEMHAHRVLRVLGN
jgi:hypothetical protein